jgi:predicted nucleic acid-binding Zn ribbon protein
VKAGIMPIYVYECSQCGQPQEHIHGIEDAAPVCGQDDTLFEMDKGAAGCGGTLERQVTAARFRFQPGVGWDGWDYVGPNTTGRTVPVSKHIDDG